MATYESDVRGAKARSRAHALRYDADVYETELLVRCFMTGGERET